jgi:aspartate kinase
VTVCVEPPGTLVQKYGGTSVGSLTRVKRVSRRIADTVAAGHRVVAVVSAMGRTTDRLIRLGRQVSSELPARELDMLVANGETITAPLVAMCLQSHGVPALSLTGSQAGIRTCASHSRARIREIRPTRVLQALGEGMVPVVAGFQGATEDLEITTLGRGGSDTTAVALAAALGAAACEIYTDVDGIMTADPRVVPDSQLLPHICYEELLEMAAMGARVMHPRAVEIGELYGIPIHVRSSFHRRPGTLIGPEARLERLGCVCAIAHDSEVAEVTVRGVPDEPCAAATVLEPVSGAGIPVDMVVRNASGPSVADLTFVVREADLRSVLRLLEPVVCRAEDCSSRCGLARVSVIGSGLRTTPGIAARALRTLADAAIGIEAVATSEIRLTCVVQRREAEAAVRALHAGFGLARIRRAPASPGLGGAGPPPVPGSAGAGREDGRGLAGGAASS